MEQSYVFFGDFSDIGGCRSKNRVFGFAELRTVIGPKRRPDLGGSLWYIYFLKIPLVCEEMSTGVVEKNRVMLSNQDFYRVYCIVLRLNRVVEGRKPPFL